MAAQRSLEDAFVAALDAEARSRFAGAAALAATLARLRAEALAAYPGITVAGAAFAAELARRLGKGAGPEDLARVRADHVHLAIACVAGDRRAIRVVEEEFLGEVSAAAARLRARADQADDVRAEVRRILFTSEPGRAAALRDYAGRGDLASYIRVIATRELVRVVNRGRREVAMGDGAFVDLVWPAPEPGRAYLRDQVRDDVAAAVRAGLAALPDRARALLRYSVIDGWTVDRIGELYGVHRATAARRVAAAREELGAAIRADLAARLATSVGEVDSIIRLVQSEIDVSVERLLA